MLLIIQVAIFYLIILLLKNDINATDVDKDTDKYQSIGGSGTVFTGKF